MSFPSTPMTVLVEAALAADLTAAPGTWSFTDVTSKIYTRDRIAITRGRADEASTADTSSLAMTANNRDGRWSTRNPSGAWYGRLRKGTPVRVSAEGHVRYTGFFSELPPRWDVSGLDRYAPLAAKGLLYRLGQGRSPARSAIARTVLHAAPTVYWALEEGTDATQVGSSLTGGPVLYPAGDVGFGQGIVPGGGAAAIDLSFGGTLAGQTGLSGTGSWELECTVAFSPFPTGNPVGNRYTVLEVQTPTSAVPVFGVVLINDTFVPTTYNLGIYRYDGSSVSATYDTAPGPMVEGQAYHVRITMTQSGADIAMKCFVDGVQVANTTASAATLYRPTAIVFNKSLASSNLPANPASISHVAIWAPVRASPTTYLATNGYAAEAAHTRFLRLCAEENIPATCAATESQPMGTQGVKTFIELVRECEASDQGYLYEGLDFGLVFQSHTERENLSAELELDYTAAGHVAPPLEPTDDDQAARNDVEVKRDGGSSSRQTEESTSVELAIPNIGRRDESETYSLATDDQTYQLAGYRLHIGTFPGYRYPTVTLNLAAGPTLIADVCAADLAFLATIDNPPTDIGPDLVAVIVEGYTETLEQYAWDIAANCSLNGPNTVGVLAATSGDTDPLLGWLDFDSLTLHTTVNTTATSWSIDAVPVDTTASDDFPRDMVVEGELITVTACSGASAPQTWIVTRSVNGVVRTHTAGAVIALAYPYVVAL